MQGNLPPKRVTEGKGGGGDRRKRAGGLRGPEHDDKEPALTKQQCSSAQCEWALEEGRWMGDIQVKSRRVAKIIPEFYFSYSKSSMISTISQCTLCFQGLYPVSI